MKTALFIGSLIGATLWAYRPSLPGEFIYDDRAIVLKNPLIRDLKQIPLILGTSYWGTHIGQPKEFKGGLYRPVTVITLALNYSIGGLNPRGYHWTNLAMHIGTSLLLGLLALRLGWTKRAACSTAFAFALFPVHTEAVSNVVGRSEVLAAFFVLLAWILSRPPTGRLAAGLGAASFAFALLSKENAAAFLPVLVLSDYVLSQTSFKTLLRERLLIWVAYAGMLVLYLEWKYLILGSIANAGGFPYFESTHFLTIGLTMAKFVFAHYLQPLVLGTSFCADFTRPSLPDARLTDPLAWTSALLLLGITAVSVVAAIKRKSRAGLCALIFALFLAPVLNLFVPLEVIGAERLLYLPSVGYGLGLGLVLDKMTCLTKTWGSVTLAGLLLWYGWGTFQRNKVWQTEGSFWKAAVQEAPQSPRAWNGLGFVLLQQNRYDEAIPLFRKALALNPRLLDALYNMATCRFDQHAYTEAKAEYLAVLNEKPFDPGTLYHLAMIAEQEKDLKSAARYYATLLEVNPLDTLIQKKIALLKSADTHERMRDSSPEK